MQTKKTRLKQLWQDLAADQSVTNRIKIRQGKAVNVGFVNQFTKHDFIPNKWFDWQRSSECKVMIIGQDWGPYSALLPYIEQYELEKNRVNFDYDEFLFRTFSSRTEKFIMNAIKSTYLDHFGMVFPDDEWQNFFFTVAVLFTRQGTHFRGNEFYDERFGTEVSYTYLKRQIEIVKPKIIIASGGTAFSQLAKYYGINPQDETISKVIQQQNFKPIIIDQTIIIPNFHPASHTDPKLQLKIWETIWNYY